MWSYLFLLPIILALWAIAGIWIVFAIAVVNRSVDLQKGFPFIRFLWLRGLMGEENGGPYFRGAKR